MAKYRIVKHEYPNGKIDYEVQKKILGLFWWNFENVDGSTTGFYDTLGEAKTAIKMDRKDLHKKTIILIMDKYKEALKKAKKLYEQGTITESLAYIFPELKESDDEKIRKAIHIYLDWLDGRNKDYQPKGDYSIKDMIAWLEKQGRQKPAWSEEDEQHIDSLLKRLEGLCRNEFERTRFAINEDKDWLESLKQRIEGE